MRAVWSFWSKPFYTYYGHTWAKPLHHLLAWGLSLEVASRHYPDTALITDRQGKKVLIDQLGLPFTSVSTELDRLDSADPGFWALGKLVAYGLQDRPFVHLDTDVFLWKALPRHLTESPVFVQHPESFYQNGQHYRHQDIEWAFAEAGLKLPAEWLWARSNRDHFRAENCGILGGSNVPFLRYYAHTAVDLFLSPANAPAWSRLPDKRDYSFVMEQFFLAACAEYHRSHQSSPFHDVHVNYLFSSQEHAFDPMHAARLGFTHLLGGAKSHPSVGLRIEERARRHFPNFYRRCEQVLMKSAFPF
jgi:hypothetical protein